MNPGEKGSLVVLVLVFVVTVGARGHPVISLIRLGYTMLLVYTPPVSHHKVKIHISR